MFSCTEYNYSYSYSPEVIVFAKTFTYQGKTLISFKLVIEDELFDMESKLAKNSVEPRNAEHKNHHASVDASRFDSASAGPEETPYERKRRTISVKWPRCAAKSLALITPLRRRVNQLFST